MTSGIKMDEIERAALLNSDEEDDKILDLNRNKSASSSSSKISKLNSQVNEVIDGMKINIEKVVERGQNLTDLNDRSESLGMSADQFSKRSRTLRKSMWLRTCRARMYLGITIATIILLFIFLIYRSMNKE